MFENHFVTIDNVHQKNNHIPMPVESFYQVLSKNTRICIHWQTSGKSRTIVPLFNHKPVQIKGWHVDIVPDTFGPDG